MRGFMEKFGHQKRSYVESGGLTQIGEGGAGKGQGGFGKGEGRAGKGRVKPGQAGRL